MLKRLCIALSLLTLSSCSTLFSPFMKFHSQESQDFSSKRAPSENSIAQAEAQVMGEKARHNKRIPTTTRGKEPSPALPTTKRMGNSSNISKSHFQWLRENRQGKYSNSNSNSYVIGSPYSNSAPAKDVSLLNGKRYIPVYGNTDKSVVREDIYGINQVSPEIQPQYLKPTPTNYFDKSEPL